MEQKIARDRIEIVFRDDRVRLLRSLYAFSRSREVAEDALAEAFAQAIRRQEEIRDMSAWIWRTSFLLASREIGAARSGSEPDGAAAYEMDEPAVDLVRALGELSPKQRGALILHHFAGHPVRDVASILGSTSASVRVHLSVGRKRMRKLLEDTDG